MIQFIHPRVRILLVLIGAFVISSILLAYSTSGTEVSPPTFELQRLSDDFKQSVSDKRSSFISLLQSIKMPSFENTSVPKPTPEAPLAQIPTPQEWETITSEPTAPMSQPKIPTSTPAKLQILPTEEAEAEYPDPYNPEPTTKPASTPTPKPTKVPAPTKIPKPTATPAPPPITSDVRPGTSIEEILKEVSKRACIPYALLMATRTEESGAWMNGMNASTTKFYNTYGWWKTAGKGEICYALGYYTQSGIIPADSGGGSCNGGVQPGAYDQKIMGLMQMGEDEQNATRKYTTPSLPKNIDRRVLFDNALIYAFATKNRLGTTPKSCDDWPEDAVKAVAFKHFGACGYPGGNYCTEIWNLYKKFR